MGALATTGRAFVVLLCCRVVVLWTQAQSPQPAHQPGPCTPQLAPAGMALSPGPGMCTRPPGEVRSPLPPGLSPCSCARATPAAGRGQGRRAPQRSSSSTCAIAIGPGQGLLGLVARGWAQQMPGCFDGGESSSPLQESRPGRGCHSIDFIGLCSVLACAPLSQPYWT